MPHSFRLTTSLALPSSSSRSDRGSPRQQRQEALAREGGGIIEAMTGTWPYMAEASL
jgi:hypothetical protein